jgi:hypothetical protein
MDMAFLERKLRCVSRRLWIGGLVVPLVVSCGVGNYFQIRIVDQQTGRGVPLVMLTTTNNITSITDSNGIVAWNEPGLMNGDVYFRIESPGYIFPGGGRTIRVTRGGHVELTIHRLNVAERLYRVTGQGIYRDSVLTGYPAPIREPVLNAQVMGQDTVRVAPYHGKLFWLWGDTAKSSSPFGNFATTAATSNLPGRGGLDASLGVNLTYFSDSDGFVKRMCPWPPEGLKWMHALMTVRDGSAVERLVARYDVIGPLQKATESGLAVFSDDRQRFEKLVVFPTPEPSVGPEGISPPRVLSDNEEFFYFCSPGPTPVARVRADWKSIQDLGAYEVFDGIRWKRSATLPTARHTWRDMEKGEPLEAYASVHWNEYRKRWIAILQKNVGEVWYAEADTPTGPWVYATRIATHGKYTYYWPVQHPFFDQDGGRVVYFEGTYTEIFSGNPVITPRYDYNQLMYRLSLDDPRLFLPAPVYRLRDGRYLMREGVEAQRAWDQIAEIPFFALPLDRKRESTVTVHGLFHALPPAGAPAVPASVLGVWNCKEADFSLELAARGEELTVSAGGLPPGRGTLRAGIAEFVVHDGDKTYNATAKLREGKLDLKWSSTQGESAQVICEPAIPSENWPNSSALALLYHYDGIYTTKPKPDAAPVARVWRNPMDTLALDRGASPISAHR